MKKNRKVFKTLVAESGLVNHFDYLNQYIGEKNPHGYHRTDIDLSFQSRSRWGSKKRSNFINSCLMNMNISKFILVDVKKCFVNATAEEDKKYFKSWLDKGVLYLNVDSNNRTITLIMFKNGDVRIPHGDYPQPNGLVYSVDRTNDTYKTMDGSLKKVFELNNMSIYVVSTATRKQLGDLFERMNNGVPLNHFEQINCIYSTTCETIRNLADDLHKQFEEAVTFSANDINRRIIDGWLAHVSYLTIKGYGKSFTKPTHREWYSSESSSNDIINQFADNFKDFINKVVGDKLKLMQHKWVIFDLFYMWNEQKNKNMVFVEDSNMVQDFVDIYTELFNDKSLNYHYLEDGIEPDEDTQRFPFAKLICGEGANTRVRMSAYKSKGWNINKYFKKPIKKDPKRVATRMEKQGIAVRDGWKDSDGDSFTPETLFDGNLDAGHVIAHNHGIEKGGVTEPDNMVIEKMSKNRGKGDKETIIKQ